MKKITHLNYGGGFTEEDIKRHVLSKQKGIRCRDAYTGRIKYAYHIDETGIAFNKNKTLCIGHLGTDLIREK